MSFEPAREEQLTEDKLKWGYWWVTHQLQVRHWTVIILAVVATVLVGYAGYGFYDWFYGSGVRERAELGSMTKPLIDYMAFHERTAPKDITTEDPIVLGGGDHSYDIIARMTNSNPQWWAEFQYRFTSSAGDVSAKEGYILPNASLWLAALTNKTERRPSSVQVILENVRWHRVNQHVTRPDYVSWANSRLQFLISDVKFTPPAPADTLPVSHASFTVTNDTGFGYYHIGFFVSLFSGSQLVGFNRVVISDLRPGEKRPVEVSWFFDQQNVSRVEVQPEVNIFDDRVYIAPGQ